jgi:hypothetical protein
MREKRNFVLVLMVIVSVVWAVLVWFVLKPESVPLLWVQRWFSVLLGLSAAVWLAYGLLLADRLPNYLSRVVGEVYYEADGLSFLPTIRVVQEQAELCVYYQNRHENPVNAIVHLRPIDDSFEIKPGWRDVHFAFRADGGDFGLIHQPITVPEHLRGEVLEFHLGAATYYHRGHGARHRKQAGLPCGTLLVDWAGAAFRTGVHEVSGEIELIRPTIVHLALPRIPLPQIDPRRTWRQEQIHAGSAA